MLKQQSVAEPNALVEGKRKACSLRRRAAAADCAEPAITGAEDEATTILSFAHRVLVRWTQAAAGDAALWDNDIESTKMI